MTRETQSHRDDDASADLAAWLRFVDYCQVAIGRFAIGGAGSSETLIQTLRIAAATLHSRASRLLSRTVILRIASRLDAGTAVAHAGEADRADPHRSRRRVAGLAHGESRLLDARVRAVLDELQEGHVRHGRQLADFAASFRVSTSHLSRLIVRETGVSFSRHLRVARMNEAVRLLDDTDLSIKEIAAATGYEHVPSFDRQFRSYFHITPSAFRRPAATAMERRRGVDAPAEGQDPLRASEGPFRQMLNHSRVSLTTQDRDLRYTWVYNLPATLDADAVIGQTDHDILTAADAERVTALKRLVLNSGEGRREHGTLTINGQECFFDYSIEPVRDAAGGIVGVSCIAIDVTELKRREGERTPPARAEHFSGVRFVGGRGALPVRTGVADEGLAARPGAARTVSPREREVVRCLLEYRRLSVVADALGISIHTARNHLKSVFRKLDLHSQDELFHHFLSRDGVRPADH